MNVRAKFRVTKVTTTCMGNNAPDTSEVTLSAAGGAPNETWAKWTPSGSITMTINNPAALAAFVVGDFVFVDFSPAPAKETDEVK